jgi:replication initiation and membrane attachment protein DnaB
VADIDEQEVERCNLIFHSVFADFPSNFQRVFGIPFDLPLNAEVSIGNNMKELEEIA